MKIAIHQPNFIPWLGYFYKIACTDAFVLLDDVQFTKNGFTNRNRIKTSQGEQWLTVPVKQSGSSDQLVNQVEIVDSERSLKKIARTVEQNYRKSPGFDSLFNEFAPLLSGGDDSLSNLNIKLIKWCMKKLNISTQLYRSSELEHISGTSTDRLISICKALNADEYLSGFGGMNYQDEKTFKSQGVKLSVTSFSHPVYKQMWGDFRSNMSIIDLIFNCPDDCGKLFPAP